MANNPSISIDIPVYNEEESLKMLYSELIQVMEILGLMPKSILGVNLHL